MVFQISPLPYAYNSLEPFIDEQTMKIHHDKHHQTYTDKLNDALKEYPDLQNKNAEELLKNLNSAPEKIRQAVINHGGGFVNHNFFWEILKKDVKISGEIEKAITKKFGSFKAFKEEFNKAALGLFGSGWAWLVVDTKGNLEILQTKNQDSPLSLGKTPILGIDVWEHSYYLLYKNNRAEYVKNFFNVINWNKVNDNYKKVVKK
ncbi:MAG TPA: superoxide dismutase [Candidatus Nanoarchaeia archaeon]|nr:superoxide dismutase [Candidatus Nanoarchaeia archaeon]